MLLPFLLIGMGAAQERQGRPIHPPVIRLPRLGITRIPSPDQKWTLIFEMANWESTRKLWIQKKTSNERKLVRDFERSLDISWSPDSSHFFVNDASGSSETNCYVYDPETLDAIDVTRLLGANSKIVRSFEADHFYVEATRWVNSSELLITLTGYLSSTPPKPGLDGAYRVNLNGSVRTLREGYFR
jgi:hypothetical protein